MLWIGIESTGENSSLLSRGVLVVICLPEGLLVLWHPRAGASGDLDRNLDLSGTRGLSSLRVVRLGYFSGSGDNALGVAGEVLVETLLTLTTFVSH